MEDVQKARDDAKRLKVDKLDKLSANIATQLSDEQKKTVGRLIVEEFDLDVASRSEFDDRRGFWRKQYSGLMEPPSGRRPKGSCTAHMPFLAVATNHFWSRAHPYLLPSKGPANIKGGGEMGLEDRPKVDRVRAFMNHQLYGIMDGFKREFGIGITQTTIDGSSMLKTWWDPADGRPSMTCVPCEDLIVSNEHTGSIETAQRVTHRLRMTQDEIRARVRDGLFLREAWHLGTPEDVIDDGEVGNMRREIDGQEEPTPQPPGSPREILEQHRSLDLDGDGIGEPYVVTVDKQSEKLLRITSREVLNKHGQVETINHFTMLPFSLNATSFYPLGLGAMLEGPGVAADSFLQLLVDQGMWQSMPPFFYSKKFLKPVGEVRYQFGEGIQCDGMVDDIKKGAMFLDVPSPSPVLFNALQEMKQQSKELSSVTEILQGLEQPTNQTATTTLVQNKNSMAFMNGVFGLMRDALGEVLKKVFQLNRLYLDDRSYSEVIGDNGSPEFMQWQQAKAQYQQMVQAAQQFMMMGQPLPPQLMQMLQETQPPPETPFSVQNDFAPTMDIYPTADPEVTSQVEELQIAERVMATVLAPDQPTPPDPHSVWATKKFFLETIHTPAEVIADVLPEPQQPGPPPNKDQHTENADALRGQPMFTLPDQDHREHIGIIDAFMLTPAAEALAPEGKEALEQHKREHWAFIVEEQNRGPQAPQSGPQAPPPAFAGGGGGMGGLPSGPMVPGGPGAGSVVPGAPPALGGRIAAIDAAAGGGTGLIEGS